MSLRTVKFDFTLFELAESVEPDAMKIIETATAAGGCPTLRQEWPAIRDALDKAITALGDGLHGPHELELGHVIDHVDVVDTPR